MSRMCNENNTGCKFWTNVCAGFISGLIVGGAIVAVLDYLEARDSEKRLIEKAVDENYYFTAE